MGFALVLGPAGVQELAKMCGSEQVGGVIQAIEKNEAKLRVSVPCEQLRPYIKYLILMNKLPEEYPFERFAKDRLKGDGEGRKIGQKREFSKLFASWDPAHLEAQLKRAHATLAARHLHQLSLEKGSLAQPFLAAEVVKVDQSNLAKQAEGRQCPSVRGDFRLREYFRHRNSLGSDFIELAAYVGYVSLEPSGANSRNWLSRWGESPPGLPSLFMETCAYVAFEWARSEGGTEPEALLRKTQVLLTQSPVCGKELALEFRALERVAEAVASIHKRCKGSSGQNPI